MDDSTLTSLITHRPMIWIILTVILRPIQIVQRIWYSVPVGAVKSHPFRWVQASAARRLLRMSNRRVYLHVPALNFINHHIGLVRNKNLSLDDIQRKTLAIKEMFIIVWGQVHRHDVHTSPEGSQYRWTAAQMRCLHPSWWLAIYF